MVFPMMVFPMQSSFLTTKIGSTGALNFLAKTTGLGKGENPIHETNRYPHSISIFIR